MGCILSRTWKNDRGDSLIMVLVAVAVAGILIAGMTNYINQMQKAVKTLEARNEAVEMIVEIKNVSATSPACRLNFVGQTLPALNTPLPFTRFRFVNAAGTALANEDVITVGKRLPLGTSIATLSLVPTVQVPPNTFLADFRIQFSNQAAYTPSIVRNIRTRVQVDATGRITDCTFEDTPYGGGGGGGVLRPCTTPPPSATTYYAAPPMPAPSGTIVHEWCPLNHTGDGNRFLCLDSQWVLTQSDMCIDTTSGN